MARIIKNEIANITNAFKNKFGDEYKSKPEYNFLIDLCNNVPDLTITDDFPNNLMVDFFEVIYEIMWEIIYNIDTVYDKAVDFFAFLEKYTFLPDYWYCVVSVFDAINCNTYKDDIDKLFNENTKIVYEKYMQSY